MKIGLMVKNEDKTYSSGEHTLSCNSLFEKNEIVDDDRFLLIEVAPR